MSQEKKHLSHEKNTSFFRLALSFLQHGLVLPPVSHPLFLFDRFTIQPVLIRTSHPSGSRRLCFKPNTCTSSTMHKTRPLVHSDPRKSSVPYRVQLFLSQILWLLANPLWTHGMGESGSKQCSAAVGGCGSYQSNLVVFIPTPLPVHCCTQTDYLKSMSSSNGT